MKLDLGSRYNSHRAGDGWLCVDIVDADIIQDLSKLPWDFEDSSIEYIRASHVLEHIHKKDAYKFLRECYRILKPKGVIALSVPDMDVFIDCHLSNNFDRVAPYIHTDLNYMIGIPNLENTDPWKHKYIYNFETLFYILNSVGFTCIVKHNIGEEPYTQIENIHNPKHENISLYVCAEK